MTNFQKLAFDSKLCNRLQNIVYVIAVGARLLSRHCCCRCIVGDPSRVRWQRRASGNGWIYGNERERNLNAREPSAFLAMTSRTVANDGGHNGQRGAMALWRPPPLHMLISCRHVHSCLRTVGHRSLTLYTALKHFDLIEYSYQLYIISVISTEW